MKRRGLLFVAVSLTCATATVQAGEIRLKNKTKLSGDVVRVDDDAVFIRLPRESIATIEGKPLPQPLIEGASAPVFAVKDILGQSHSMGAGQGKVTLLHFWVHWCPHCRTDAPKVQALYDQFRDNPNVQVLTVNLDDDRAVLDQFVKEHQVTYPVTSAAEQAAVSDGVNLQKLYEVNGFPLTYLIDAQGTIRYKISGSFVEANQDVGKLVTELLAVPQPKNG